MGVARGTGHMVGVEMNGSLCVHTIRKFDALNNPAHALLGHGVRWRFGEEIRAAFCFIRPNPDRQNAGVNVPFMAQVAADA